MSELLSIDEVRSIDSSIYKEDIRLLIHPLIEGVTSAPALRPVTRTLTVCDGRPCAR